jgi:polyhydroxyalkanoate synthase subunit PhaC
MRLAAGLHRDFIHIGLNNSFMRPGALEVLGQPVDLQQVDLDTYFVAGLTDHIVPWESAYNGARLFGGNRRFVLSSSGHIQALVNPPPTEGAESRASYRVADELPEGAELFLAQAPRLSGSWWSDWDNWLAERSGELKPAPNTLGNRAHKAQAKAPGTYVLAN